MTETPLLDQLDALGDAGIALLGACEQIIDQAAHELRIRDRARYEGDLEERVTAYLADHPGASANEVHAALGGTRAAVLAAVRAVRTITAPCPHNPPFGHHWSLGEDGLYHCAYCGMRAEIA